MRVALSSITIESYLPEIRRIFTFLEMELFEHSERLEKKESLILFYLEKEIPLLRLMHAIAILGQWLQGTKFGIENMAIKKLDPSARWVEVVDILEEKLMEFANQAPVIELILSPNGRVTRKIGETTLSHDFEGDSMKVDLLKLLAVESRFVSPKDICRRIDCKNTKALSTMKKTINDVLQVKLQLPKKKDFIEGKRGPGYRIDALYNLVVVR